MRTAGVDLAAEPKGTALAVIEWAQDAARLVELRLGVADAAIVETVAGVDKLGIDCAFGWPDAFVEFVSAHSAGRSDGAPVDGGMEWRRTLAYRETDRRARASTGRWPLSVSTDRLGLTAMRCAGLLARLGEAGIDVDRSGSGRVVEVYPGASLRLWGFDTSGYRTDADSRRRVLTLLSTEAPWLDLAGFADLMVVSGDAFDAVIAALAARSAALGLYEPPASGVLEQARREGWIALPTGALRDLKTGAHRRHPHLDRSVISPPLR
ncbi:DUF429 domain-containing protein [Herbiconiux sp. CPCC 205763]|uniref:DUF429 domain-containing protein n=1 Tax=Herbiconiux aconitum TaxID=2970913 RepID=A0ABT2GYP5_9MICO|nr:DUF429 domain-containing protein [Herbiconiux aconitum]MCS5720049.1 DUF429 domain-containing protein [Herbiconiux aconitum]